VCPRRSGPRRTILHMELAEVISQRAGPGHPRWARAIGNGMNDLLVCLASAPLAVTEEDADVAWHESGEFWPSPELAFWSHQLEASIARLASSG